MSEPSSIMPGLNDNDSPSASGSGTSRFPPLPLSSHLPGHLANQAALGSINKEAWEAVTAESRKRKRNTDTVQTEQGPEKVEFSDMKMEDQVAFLYKHQELMKRDLSKNQLRLYGVKKNDTNDTATEVLRTVFKDGLKLGENKVKEMISSALTSVQRVDNGRAILFQLNRVDYVNDIFRNISNLRAFTNPYNSTQKISISHNLSDTDNKLRKQALLVKELLKNKGYTVKVRSNVLLSVNGSQFKHFTQNILKLQLELPVSGRGLKDSLVLGQLRSSNYQHQCTGSFKQTSCVWHFDMFDSLYTLCNIIFSTSY